MLATIRSKLGLFGLALGVLTLMAPIAAHATEQTSTSSPNGRLTVRSATLSITNVDQDGNADTATYGDVVEFVGSVTNKVASAQRVSITAAFDLPGTHFVFSLTKRVVLAGGRTEQVRFKAQDFSVLPQRHLHDFHNGRRRHRECYRYVFSHSALRLVARALTKPSRARVVLEAR